MAGTRWPPEDSDLFHARTAGAAAAAPAAAAGGVDLVSDDDRSVAADSWSIKSDYGSTLDDEQRHVDSSDVLSSCNFPSAPDYNSDRDVPDANEVETSLLGLQSYWDAYYAEDLANFQENGHPGELWLGVEVTDILVTWITNLCSNICKVPSASDANSSKSESSDTCRDLSRWSVLDIGTGNGLLLHELAKRGFSGLTGIDYSEGAIEIARCLASHGGFTSINFVVDDVLETKLGRQFKLVMDKGTLDVIGLHPDGPVRRVMYWESLANLVTPGGILVITSCNSTKDELMQEVDNFNLRRISSQQRRQASSNQPTTFQYLDHVHSYPTVTFGGIEGSRVSTVAFLYK